jgi:hypothetical protein
VTIKFNFYDIYGFALPGFLVLALLWLPFGLIDNNWPDAEFSSALLGIIIAYFAGHLLQTIAQLAIPSNFLDGRFPSAKFLDQEDPTFTSKVKEKLLAHINEVFKIEVPRDPPKNATDETRREVDKLRNDTFFLCRSALVKSRTIIYAEQFEGLYALMRGLCAGFGIATFYYLGWAYSGQLQFIKSFRFVPSGWWYWPWSGVVILLGIFIAFFAMTAANRNKQDRSKANIKQDRSRANIFRRVMIGSFILAAFAAGYYFGLSRAGASLHRGQLVVAAVISFFASERCYSGYKTFAQEFAKAVYRDFINYDKPAPGPAAGNGEAEEDA